MTHYVYDETKLIADLAGLGEPARTAFAAACAERLLLLYARFHTETGQGDPKKVSQALERLWADLAGDPMSADELSAEIEALMALVPSDEDDNWTDLSPYAQNAVTAATYALESRRAEQPQLPAWSARQAYEAIDYFVTNSENVDFNSPGIEEHVLRHPLVQAELARQQRDLSDLRKADSPFASLFNLIRERSRAETISF